MGLFGKKEKKTCPLCGGKLGFLDADMLNNDETICDKCSAAVSKWWPRTIYEASPETAKTILRWQEMEPEERAKEFSRYGDPDAALYVFEAGAYEEVCEDAPSECTEEYHDTWVVNGPVLFGDFKRGDDVRVVGEGVSIAARVADCTEATRGSLDLELNDRPADTYVPDSVGAWLILAVEPREDGEKITENCMVIKEY